MRAVAAGIAALVLFALAVTSAGAAPTEVRVRIEGNTKTLFEGPILTEGHDVRAASDVASRPCDGTNNGAHSQPSATPTAASVDAMAIVGEDFDGEWYSGYDDYFITRWGPDHESGSAFWGVLVNGAFTSVGGCQFAAQAGDEVLWAFDAFGSRPFLRLASAADSSPMPGPALPTATVEEDEPLALSVKSSTGAMDGAPESIQPVDSALVAPVLTDAQSGYQEVQVGDPSTVATAADGTVSVSFPTPGWYRLKAAKSGYVRSNRLDVCVEPGGGGSCGPLPADAQVRTPPPQPSSPESQPPSGHAAATSGPGVGPTPPPLSSFSFGRVVSNAKSGAALLTISVPGPGRLTVSGSKVKRSSVWVGGAGDVRLRVKTKGKALERLRRNGRVTVAVKVSFSPAGGAATTAQRKVVLKLGETAG
ncbi:MAG TPA: hypothetical protein VFM94_01720 [Solirubrobacterales bacterium]|nr:hypothetical protein [Solirubrobacterales bacterium]